MMNDPGKYRYLKKPNGDRRALWRGIVIAVVLEIVAFSLIIFGTGDC